jgi:hypothetical protein
MYVAPTQITSNRTHNKPIEFSIETWTMYNNIFCRYYQLYEKYIGELGQCPMAGFDITES